MDIASLGIKITQQGADEAKAKLDALTASGAQAEKQLTSSAAKISQSVSAQSSAMKEATGGTEGLLAAQRRWLAELPPLTTAEQQLGTATRLTTLEVNKAAEAFDRMVAAQQASIYSTQAMAKMQMAAIVEDERRSSVLGKLGITAEGSGHGMQFLGREMGMLAAESVGVQGMIGKVVAGIAGLGVSALATLGVFVGLAALGLAYEQLTEASRKQREEQERNVEALQKWYEKQKEGPAGNLVPEIAAITAHLKELQATLDHATTTGNAPLFVQLKAQLQGLLAGGDPFAQAGAVANYLRKWYEDQADAIAKGGDARAAAIREANKKAVDAMNELQGKFASNLGTVATFTLSPSAIAQVNAAEADFRKQLANVQATRPQDLEEQARLIGIITNLAQASLAPLKAMEQEWAAAVAAVAADTEKLKRAGLDQIGTMQKVNEENNVSALKAKQAADAVGVQGATLDLLRASQKAELDTLTALHTLSGVALSDRLRQIQATKDEEEASARAKLRLEDQVTATKVMAETQKSANDVAEENIKITKKQTDAPAAIKKNIQYAQDLARIWRDGLGKILTDGLKSWNDFFDDVFRLFSRLMDRMQKEGKGKGLGYQLLGAGASAIAGGSAGYAVGQYGANAAGGAGLGGLAGAVTGFQIAGPVGAIVGGLAGAVGGLLGASNAQKEAAQALKNAAATFANNIASFANPSSPTAAITGQADQLRQQADDLFNQRLKAASKGGLSQSEFADVYAQYQKDLSAVNAAEKERNRLLQEEAEHLRVTTKESLAARLARAQGNITAADAIDRGEEERRQIEEVIKQFGPFSDVLTALLQTLTAEDAAIAAAKAQANQRAIEDAYLAADRAAASGPNGSQAARDVVDRQALVLQHQREIADLEAQQASAELIAATKAKDAAEEAALAWQQAQAAIQQATSDIARDIALGFKTPGQGREAEAAAFGFGGLTNDQIRALYTPYNGTALTDQQEQTNKNIEQFFRDFPDTVGTAVGDVLANSVAKQNGQTEAIRFAAQTLTEVTGNRMADYLASLVTLEREELDIQRRAFAGGSAIPFTPAQSPAANLPAIDKLTASLDKLAAKAESSASGQPVTFAFTFKETVDLTDPKQRQQIVDAFDLYLLQRAKDSRLRAGSTLKDV